MKKHSFVVFAILVLASASSNAGVAEEYKSIEVIDAEQAPAAEEAKANPVAELVAVEPAEESAVVAQPVTVRAVPTQNAGIALVPRYADPTMAISAAVPSSEKTLRITPMFGGAIFNGAWAANTRNQFGLGLGVEIPVSPYLGFEIEGGYNKYRVAYTVTGTGGPVAGAKVHNEFDLFLLGGNGKIYLSKTKLRPYIGAGLTAMLYDNMYGALASGGMGQYSTLIGSANLMFGLDLAVSDSLSFGARASYLVPVINRPFSAIAWDPVAGVTAAPGVEEAALIQQNLWRIMGTMTVHL